MGCEPFAFPGRSYRLLFLISIYEQPAESPEQSGSRGKSTCVRDSLPAAAQGTRPATGTIFRGTGAQGRAA